MEPGAGKQNLGVADSDPLIFSNRKEHCANSKDQLKSNWKLEIGNVYCVMSKHDWY